ncbi:hypothetical protein AAHA92_33457 [Salvia divinorum]|uniref:Uncharacterized protein n=1 Tax=Salvia divinorum TaxID=28513 RepID=A0ABD1FP15_SALDI
MASSSCSKTLTLALVLVIALCILSSDVDAGRPGRMTAPEEDVPVMSLKYFREDKDKLFHVSLPKGVSIPPSAPSKRHNSAPLNR